MSGLIGWGLVFELIDCQAWVRRLSWLISRCVVSLSVGSRAIRRVIGDHWIRLSGGSSTISIAHGS
jgi:hypothetical protein